MAGFLGLSALAGIALWVALGPEWCETSDDRSPNPPPLAAISGGALYATSFPDLTGHPQSLAQWPQDWLLLNFWATWCGPCREEMPLLAQMQRKYADRHLKVLGIAADQPLKATNFAKEARIDYLLLADEAGALEFAKRLGNTAGVLPYSVLVSPGGAVVWTRAGGLSTVEAEALLNKHLPK